MRLPLTVAAILSALSLAACGSDGEQASDEGGGGKPEEVLAAAIDKSSSAESYRAKVSVDVTEGERVQVSGEIVSNADSSKALGTMSFKQGDKPAAEMKTLTVDGKQYLQAPEITGELPEGKTWVQTPDANAGTLTPKQFMDLLRDSGEIEDKGEEDVGGRKTVHLGGPLDLTKLAEYTDNEALKRQASGENLDKLDATIDVWIDEEADQIAKMELAMEAEGKKVLSSGAEMLEYGVSLDEIKAPPASEVVTQGG